MSDIPVDLCGLSWQVKYTVSWLSQEAFATRPQGVEIIFQLHLGL